jgi:hypothetical protein
LEGKIVFSGQFLELAELGLGHLLLVFLKANFDVFQTVYHHPVIQLGELAS